MRLGKRAGPIAGISSLGAFRHPPFEPLHSVSFTYVPTVAAVPYLFLKNYENQQGIQKYE